MSTQTNSSEETFYCGHVACDYLRDECPVHNPEGYAKMMRTPIDPDGTVGYVPEFDWDYGQNEDTYMDRVRSRK